MRRRKSPITQNIAVESSKKIPEASKIEEKIINHQDFRNSSTISKQT